MRGRTIGLLAGAVFAVAATLVAFTMLWGRVRPAIRSKVLGSPPLAVLSP
jgi:hypothetical protein